jgi:hypothetical protein
VPRKAEKTLGEFIAELQAIQAEHGSDIPIHIGGGQYDGITVKTSNKGMHRGDQNPVVRAIVDFA